MEDINKNIPSDGSVVDIFSVRATQITSSKSESMRLLRDKIDKIKRYGGDGTKVMGEVFDEPSF